MGKAKGNGKDTRTQAQKDAEKKAKFAELCEERVNKANNRILFVAKLASPNYLYTEEQWRAAVASMRASIDAVESAFQSGGKGGGGFKLPK